MNSSSSESDGLDTTMTQNKLPANTKELYKRAYNNFIIWRNERGKSNFSEDVFLAYFKHLAKTKQPTTLWSIYSMLKFSLQSNNGINIKEYTKVLAFIKNVNKGYKTKKSKVFTSSEIETFLNEAPDKEYLAVKVVLLIGVLGGCRCMELLNLKVNDVEKHSEQLLLVKVRDRFNEERSFVIDEHKDIVEKYMALRPADAAINRFLICYQNGRCHRQVIGRNNITRMPQKIASFLKLPNPKLYTGHCFRRTASLLSTGIQLEVPRWMRQEQDHIAAIREVYIANPPDNEAVEINTKCNLESKAEYANMKVSTSPIWSGSPSPHRFESDIQDRELSPPPRKKERFQELEHGRLKEIKFSESTNNNQPSSECTRNITIIFENCKKVSNININL